MKKYKVCFVHKDIGDINRGGVSISYKALINGFLELGWEVYCITQREFTTKKVKVINVPEELDPYLHSENVRNELEKLNVDIIESSNYKFELLSYLIHRKKTHTKVIIRCNPSSESFLFGNALTEGERNACSLSDAVIAISKFAQKDLEKIYKVHTNNVIYEGIDLRVLNSYQIKESINSGHLFINNAEVNTKNLLISQFINKDKINIFWCGKPNLMKGFDILQKVIRNSPDSINFIINMAPSAEVLEWDKISLSKCVFFYEPSKEDQINIWRNCDITLITSRVEGFSLVAAESLLLGKPLVVNKECKVINEFPMQRYIDYFNPKDANELYSMFVSRKKENIKLNSTEVLFLDSNRTVEESLNLYLKLLNK